MKKIIFLAISFCYIQNVSAQSLGTAVINTTGNSVIMNGSTFEWSVGEPATQTNSFNGGLVTEGVLQPFFLNLENIQANGTLSTDIKLLPTIGSGSFNFTLEKITSGTFKYQVYDVTGKVVLEKSINQISTNNYTFNIGDLATSIYFVLATVTQDNKIFYNHFKITKQ
jgi:hypothetical protein